MRAMVLDLPHHPLILRDVPVPPLAATQGRVRESLAGAAVLTVD